MCLKICLIILIVMNLLGCPSSTDSVPAEWNPRIVKGEQFFSKKTFLDVSKIGIVTDISSRNVQNKKNEKEIIISGKYGAVFADNEGQVLDAIMFSETGERIVYFESRRGGDYIFLNRGGGGQSPAVYDKSGKLVWKYSPDGVVPNDMSAGDINGDGNTEFVVGQSGGGGIVLLNQNGSMLWQMSDKNVWHVEMIDYNDDGRLEIAHSNNMGEIVIRNANGAVIKQKKSPLYFAKFSLLHWANLDGRLHYLISENQKLWLISSHDNNKINQFDAPMAADNFTLGTPIRFDGGRLPFFAAVVEVRTTWKRSILYIYSPKKELIYQEILPTSIAALSTVSNMKSGEEILLVGGDGMVWKYSITKK